MSYHVLTLADRKLWTDLLESLPIEQQDIYYTPEYYSLYQANGDGEANCFVYREGNDLVLYPFLKNSINKLGYQLDEEYHDIQGAYGYNGIVTSSKDIGFITNFHTCFKQYCADNNIVAEFTRFHPLLKNYFLAASGMEVLFDRKTMFLELNDNMDVIFANFQRTTKKQIRRCIDRYHIEVKVVENAKQVYLDDFVRIYHAAMDRVHSTEYLYFNKSYFDNLFDMRNVVLFVATLESEPIAMITAMKTGWYFHGHLGGGLTEYMHYSAYSLLYKEMISYALGKGFKYLHTGGGTTSREDDSLLRFKMNFSKSLADFYVGKTVYNGLIYSNIIDQWKEQYPLSYERNKNKLLGYREI